MVTEVFNALAESVNALYKKEVIAREGPWNDAAEVTLAERGARFGPAKVGGYQLLLRGLSPLVVTISTGVAAPVVAAMRPAGTPAPRGARRPC
jgi:hypothetical protein